MPTKKSVRGHGAKDKAPTKIMGKKTIVKKPEIKHEYKPFKKVEAYKGKLLKKLPTKK